MTEYGTSPVGRIIMGDPWTKTTRDQNGRDLPPEKQRFFFGLAIAKDAPGVNEMLGTLQKAAVAGYGHAPHIMQQINMGLTAPNFSWKVQDGDEQRVNPQTGALEDRTPHGKGCWVFKFSTTLPIRAAKYQGNVPIDCSPIDIKRGYYVQVAYSTQPNGNMDHTAGVYLNPQTVCLVGFGEEIVSGPSLDQQFTGGPGGYVPPGMSTTPLAPTGAPSPMGMPQTGQPMGMPQTGQPMGMPQTGQPMGMPQTGQPTGMPAPQQPMQQPQDMPSGNPMQQQTAPAMPTGSPGSGPPAANPFLIPGMPGAPAAAPQQPPPYGGYMNTQR